MTEERFPKPGVLVTGASRGIGRAIALKFASEGHPVFLNCIHSKDKLTELQQTISCQYSVPCHMLVGDVSDPAFVQELFNAARRTIGEVDILINNAGISHMGLLSDMSFARWDEVIRTNLSSCFYCSKLAIPSMVRNHWGKIINVSSIWGVCGASCEAAYSASKGGVNALTRALGKELAPSNVQVNAIACGVIDTDMNRCLSEEERTALAEEIPAGRFAAPEEVAQLAYSIASGTGYLNGQVIVLDGAFI